VEHPIITSGDFVALLLSAVRGGNSFIVVLLQPALDRRLPAGCQSVDTHSFKCILYTGYQHQSRCKGSTVVSQDEDRG